MKAIIFERITIDPDACHGKPCIRGLPYPVETILECLNSGMTIADILEDYEDIYAALNFAAHNSTQRIENLAA